MMPRFVNESLPIELHDGIKLFKIDAKWGADGDKLMKKLKNLDAFTIAAIELWAYAFWYGPHHKQLSAEEYTKHLL